MTFEEWFKVGDEEWPYPEQIEERYYEQNLDPDDIKELMKEAYEAGREQGYDEGWEDGSSIHSHKYDGRQTL